MIDKKHITGVITLALACIFLTAAASLAHSAETDIAILSLQGKGQINVAPDMAVISVQIVEIGTTAAEALSKNAQKLSTVFEALKEQDIDPKYIQTQGLRLTPLYNDRRNRSEERKIISYQVNNGFTVKVADIEKTGPILDMIVKLGINQINQIQFTISDTSMFIKEARILATKDALEKAALYAETAGFKLGDIIHFTENSRHSSSPRPYPMQATMAKAMVAEAQTPVVGGELTIEANVSISWKID